MPTNAAIINFSSPNALALGTRASCLTLSSIARHEQSLIRPTDLQVLFRGYLPFGKTEEIDNHVINSLLLNYGINVWIHSCYEGKKTHRGGYSISALLSLGKKTAPQDHGRKDMARII